MFRKVLVANRGEIAVRVIRSLRALHVKSVAVYSDADRGAIHTRLADQAVEIGPAAPARSYLAMDRLVEVCKRTGAEAVHPGYGFLSENAEFARRLKAAGIVFIGPSPEAMAKLGDKVAARRLAIETGVPTAPGSDGAVKGPDEVASIAKKIGYPVILKAAAGGGGIGMQVVRSDADLAAAYERAVSTATSAFGDGSVFVEKYVQDPRHIEVQVLGDHHGHLVHLFERECSIQRRHQKLVEEAPSPALSPALRAAVCDDAVRLAKAGGYSNAGTMEFLFDGKRFYFNEMNTRLQVEHPVTELVTGLDLVALQVRISAGEALPFAQGDVKIRGWAIECRLNAEDPARNFAPSPGKIERFDLPKYPWLRVDTWGEPGARVPQEYDSLVAKVITSGADRDEAVQRMQRALAEVRVEGVRTNLDFHRVLFAHDAFRKGDLATTFIERHDLVSLLAKRAKDTEVARRDEAAAVAAALAAVPGALLRSHQRAAPKLLPPDESSAWRRRAREEALRRRG
ncbi:MAG: acetyl-CoA carboxylase biotin carboxylase subunit [Methanobacteriota archaeon]